MRKYKVEDEKGLAGADALIAIIIIVIFSSIVINFGYNIYLINTSVARTSRANSYAVAVLEGIDKIYYDDVNIANIEKLFGEDDDKVSVKYTDDEDELITPYRIEIDIKSYTDVKANGTQYLDLVKKITIHVKYNIENKEQEIIVSRLKKRENLVVPNKQSANSDELVEILSENQEAFPIKYENSAWIVTNFEDTTWYNYNNGYWATILVSTSNLQPGDIIGEIASQTNNIYIWIPRYAYKGTDVEFLYYSGNQYVYNGEYDRLQNIGDEYNVLPEFTEGTQGIWLMESETNVRELYTRLNESKYKRKNLINMGGN